MKKKLSKVSVVINTYNGASFILKSVSSVLQQSYKNFEIIIWDNCSTDNTKDLINNLKDKRIRYFRSKKFQKLYKARDMAIKKCKGEFIAFLDVDDWWDHNKLKFQLDYFDDKNVGIVSCDYQIINERKLNKKKISLRFAKNSDQLDYLLKEYKVGFSTLVIRKCIYNSRLKFNEKFEVIGDFDFVIRALQFFKLAHVDKTLSFYRWHGENLSIKKFNVNILELKKWIKFHTGNQIIANKKNFIFFKDKLNFLNSIYFRKKKLNKKCLNILFKTKNIIIKIKILIVLILPIRLLNFIRS